MSHCVYTLIIFPWNFSTSTKRDSVWTFIDIFHMCVHCSSYNLQRNDTFLFHNFNYPNFSNEKPQWYLYLIHIRRHCLNCPRMLLFHLLSLFFFINEYIWVIDWESFFFDFVFVLRAVHFVLAIIKWKYNNENSRMIADRWKTVEYVHLFLCFCIWNGSSILASPFDSISHKCTDCVVNIRTIWSPACSVDIQCTCTIAIKTLEKFISSAVILH